MRLIDKSRVQKKPRPETAGTTKPSPGLEQSDCLVRLSENWYPIAYRSHTTHYYRDRTPKVTIFWTVVSQDRNCGKILPSYYNVSELFGSVGEGGKFKATPRGNLYRDFCAVVAGNHRADDLPLSILCGVEIVGEVVTVDTDWERRPLPERGTLLPGSRPWNSRPWKGIRTGSRHC